MLAFRSRERCIAGILQKNQQPGQICPLLGGQVRDIDTLIQSSHDGREGFDPLKQREQVLIAINDIDDTSAIHLSYIVICRRERLVLVARARGSVNVS